jgi:hypothetical protein
VWQRQWRGEVASAIREAAGDIESFSLLVAEMQWKNGAPETRRITPDWTVLKSLHTPPAAVVRIFPSVARTAWSPDAVNALSNLLQGIRDEFTANGVSLGEMQLDYDCPESKLADYRRLVQELKRLHPAPPLTITALPSWLPRAEFTALAREVPGYVLQVHSLHLPQSNTGLVGLCDTAETRAAVRAAASLHVPFRVALPTYSCVVQFDASGKVAEVYAEDLPAGFPQSSAPYAVLDSDAYQSEALLNEWRKNTPSELQAVIWYRLPVKSDRLNWDWSTLQKLCRNVPLRRGWLAQAVLAPGLHHEIVLRNTGDAPDDLPPHLTLHAGKGSISASDGLGGYAAELLADGSVSLRLLQRAMHPRLPPGKEARIGWCRTTVDRAEVTAQVISK